MRFSLVHRQRGADNIRELSQHKMINGGMVNGMVNALVKILYTPGNTA